ncbi:Protein of unknown function, partial [Gryllus bimaculatus]
MRTLVVFRLGTLLNFVIDWLIFEITLPWLMLVHLISMTLQLVSVYEVTCIEQDVEQ